MGKLLMHYGYKFITGLRIQTLLAYMVLEMGVSLQSLQQSYKEYGD